MKRIEWTLEREGYRVINSSYPSTRMSVQAAAAWLGKLLAERTPPRTGKLHFVTHSLGGIVLRQYLLDHHPENLGRVVMLAPPNQGSELADTLIGKTWFKLFTGPAGQELGTGAAGLPTRLGSATFELGVIAGDRSLNPWFSGRIPGPDDGKVSVRSTRLEGMKDFLVVHNTHTWMMWRERTWRETVLFLQSGHFEQQALPGMRLERAAQETNAS